ncbi:MAG TPA: hypothetical protein VK752_18320 [Bryobacteraceae bacterium]|nr:hypothetical protein [Bryobacteraceae bacterium]
MRPCLFIVSMVVLISSCQNMPEPYAPPEQRQPFEGGPPHRILPVVNMSDGNWMTHLVQDVPPGDPSPWKWTGQKPTLKVVARTNQGLRYVIDFSIAEATLKFTGPVTLTFLVNDHPLDSIRYTASGDYHYEKAVPPEWVEPKKDTLVAASIDKVWIAPADGAKLGFILTRIGLTQ